MIQLIGGNLTGRVDLGVMVMIRYSILPRSPEQDFHFQMLFRDISRTLAIAKENLITIIKENNHFLCMSKLLKFH